jgi:carbonic anhydrase
MTKHFRFSRRSFVSLGAATLALPSALLGVIARAAGPSPRKEPKPGDPDAVLALLMAGNERFAAEKPENPRREPDDFLSVREAQDPLAVIVSCADSRVPPELLFDMGVGDLFIVRVAGNVVGGAGVVVKGSIEYAIAELDVSLVMVLGHSGCGAVKAAVHHVDQKDSLPGAINGLVELVKPAVLASRGTAGDPLENAIKENVRQGVERLKALEPILAPKVAAGSARVVGGVYDLKSGRVTLL